MKSMTLHDVLLKYRPHSGLTAAPLIDKLSVAKPGTDPWGLDLTEEEREVLGSVLAERGDPPTQLEVERSLAALTAKHLRGHERALTQEIAHAEASGDNEAVSDLLALKRVVRRGAEGLEE